MRIILASIFLVFLSSVGFATQDYVSVADYAVCNGTGDQAAAIMAADAAATPAGRALIFPGGSCRVVGTLTPLTNAHWIGQGRGTVITQGSATNKTFEVSNPGFVIENMQVIPDTGVTRPATAITFDLTAIGATTLRNVDVAYSGVSFNILTAGLNTVTLDHVMSSGVTANGIDLQINGCFLCFILNSEFSGNPNARGYAHVLVTSVEGQLELINDNMFQANQGIVIAPGNGQVVTLVKGTQVWIDSNPTTALSISTSGTGLVERVDFSQGWIGNYGTGGAAITGNVNQVNLSDNDMPGSGAVSHFGVSVTGTTHVTLRNNRIFGVSAAGANGIVFSGAMNCAASDNQVGPNVTTGIALFGTTDYCDINHNDLTGSTVKFSSSASGAHNKNTENMGYN